MHQASKFSTFVFNLVRKVMHVWVFPGSGKLASCLTWVLLPKGKVCVPIRTGANMIIDPRNKHEVIMLFDIFSKYFSELQLQLLRPGDIFVDCGANIGYMSFFAAPIVTKTGKVVAIEANPYCVERIKESKEAGNHSNVEIKALAVGDGTGQVSFNIANDSMYSSLCNVDKLDWTSARKTISVKVESLDKIMEDLFTTSAQKIRLLKMDVEGAEVMAISGARKLLETRRIDYIYAELHSKQLALLGYEVDDFHSIMKDYNYYPVPIVSPTNFIYSSPDVPTWSEY